MAHSFALTSSTFIPAASRGSAAAKKLSSAPRADKFARPKAWSAQPAAPTWTQLCKVSLSKVRDPKAHYVGLRPALIETAGTAFGEQIRGFQKRTTPEALLDSPLCDDMVFSAHGRQADGTPLVEKRATLADRIAPYLANRASFGEGGAYSFTPIMVNKDRSVPAEFAHLFPPAEPWHNYFLGSEPETFPADLLGVGIGEGTDPKLNTSLILGVGMGIGQEFHWHGGNVFVQVHGEKKWSLFSNPDLYAYFAPGKQYERRKPCPFDAQYADLFKDVWWQGPVDMPRPTELITRPGDALYLPTGTWHATWNLTDYTFGYTKVIDA